MSLSLIGNNRYEKTLALDNVPIVDLHLSTTSPLFLNASLFEKIETLENILHENKIGTAIQITLKNFIENQITIGEKHIQNVEILTNTSTKKEFFIPTVDISNLLPQMSQNKQLPNNLTKNDIEQFGVEPPSKAEEKNLTSPSKQHTVQEFKTWLCTNPKKLEELNTYKEQYHYAAVLLDLYNQSAKEVETKYSISKQHLKNLYNNYMNQGIEALKGDDFLNWYFLKNKSE